MVNVWAGEPPGGGLFKEFLGEDVPLGPWNPGTFSLYQSYFSWILLPYTRVNSPNPPYPTVAVFQKLLLLTNTDQPKQNRLMFLYFWMAISGFPSLD